MDWNQILLRKMVNVALPYSHIDAVDTTVIIGRGCNSPMVCSTPFVIEMPEEQILSQNKFSHEYNFIVSYKHVREKPSLINKNCILELNGDTIDPKLIKKFSPGAFYVNLTHIYNTLLQYEQTLTGMKKNMRLPVCAEPNSEIDLLKLFNMKHSTADWVLSLRKLFPDIPFGIRIPANFIERDVILALVCEADFIILDCVDTRLQEANTARPLIASLPAIARVRRILSRLNNEDITLILGMPDFSTSKYMKMFLLGAGLILLNGGDKKNPVVNGGEEQLKKGQNETCSQTDDKDPERIYQLENIAMRQLRLDILECGNTRLRGMGKENLLTTSLTVKEYTDIAFVFDADNVCLPCYNIKKKVKSREF